MSFDRVQVLRRETRRFADVLTGVGGNPAVPTCPGWEADDLLWHLAEVHLFWGAVIASGATTDEQIEAIETAKPLRPTSRRELLGLLERSTADLATALSSGDDADRAWSWFSADQSIGFTRRMQAHEATIHRVDAELTAGVVVSPIPAAVALDGVDHVIDVMWNWVPATVESTSVGVMELRPVGADARMVELYRWEGSLWGRDFSAQIGARRAPAGSEASAVVTGAASELDKLLWGRPGIATRSGSPKVLAAFGELLEFGIQ